MRPHGHRHADLREQRAGQFLVLGDRFGNGAGAIGFGGEDSALARAVAQLHQAARAQTADRNAAGFGGPHDGSGAGTETHFVCERFEFLDLAGDVERGAVNGGQTQLVSGGQAGAGQFFFLVFDDDFKDAGFGGLSGTAKAHGRAGETL